MSMPWKKARECINDLPFYTFHLKNDELRKQNFQQGEFIVNSYLEDGDMLGMDFYSIGRKSILFTEEIYNRIFAFASERGLQVIGASASDKPEINTMCLSFNGQKLVCLSNRYFAAASSDLFEDIGREIYSLDKEKSFTPRLL